MMYDADALNDLDQLRSRYDVLRVLGHDGPFVVYAVRIRASGRHFAVKVMDHADSRSANPAVLHVWQAHTVERLDHPKIMVLQAVHHLQGGAVAMAMERRRGRTLAEHLEEAARPLPFPEIESILRDTGEALAYLHGRGVVHRGVRPHSIFVDRDSGHARLAHFGIEKGDEGASTSPGAMLATFAYLAPEQISGETVVDGRAVTARTDLFSLGLVGHMLVMGSHPWEVATDLRSLLQEREQPLPELSSARPDIPENLLQAIEGCLDPSPRRRWKSAEEFLTRLAVGAEREREKSVPDSARLRARAANGVTALRAALGERLSAAARGRLAIVGPGAAIGLVALGVIQGTEDPHSTPDSPPQASTPVVEDSSDESVGTGNSPLVGSIPRDWDPFQPESIASLEALNPEASGTQPVRVSEPTTMPADLPTAVDALPQVTRSRRPSTETQVAPPQRTAPSSPPRSVPPVSPDRRPRDTEPVIQLPGQRFVSSSPAHDEVDLLGVPVVRSSTFSLLGNPIRSEPRP